MRRLVVLAVVAGCAPGPPAVSAPPTVVMSEPGADVADPADPTPSDVTLTLAELREEVADLLVYPPTACLVRQLVGDRFAALEARGGYYPVDEIEEAVAYQGAVCPQPGCDRALTWIRPDGAIVVALEDGATTTLFTNRRALSVAPPDVVRAFLDEGAQYVARDTTWQVQATRPCRGIEAATQAYRATKAHRACDARFAQFWDWAVAWPRSGAEVAMVQRPQEATFVSVPAGALVALGAAHADADGIVCGEFRIGGVRSVGYLPQADLVRLEDPLAASSAVARAPRPDWLGPAPVEQGDLTVSLNMGPPVTLEVVLQRVMAGHICEARGTLDEQAPRLFGGGTVGCDARALVLANGVYFWENGDCSGARATCTGGYW